MTVWKILSCALLALAALGAGCGGPCLVVRNIDGYAGTAYFRPTRDGGDNPLAQGTPEQPIGALPTEWEIPEGLLGGHGAVRVAFDDGLQVNVYDFMILRSKDTVIQVSHPAGIR
ncbi:MAG: hypothetical protein ACRELB_16425 [Polyangiaceae bacterium]